MEIRPLIIWLGILCLSVGILVGCSPIPAANTLGTPTSVTVQTPLATATNPGSTSAPLRTRTPASVADLSPTELKYQLIDKFNKIFFCDRDLYPVAHEVNDQEIAQRVAEIRQNAEEYRAILAHLGLKGLTDPTPAQNRLIDAEHKRLSAIELVATGQDYAFALTTGDRGDSGSAIKGTISPGGVITVTAREQSINQCPICLAGSTLIDTPQGAVPIQDLRMGTLVWTASSSGSRIAAEILQTVRRPVPGAVLVVHLILENGRELFVSAGHPTLDGRLVGDLVPGDVLDGVRVISVAREPLGDDATFDILPAGPTGAYWANGVLLGSTLSTK